MVIVPAYSPSYSHTQDNIQGFVKEEAVVSHTHSPDLPPQPPTPPHPPHAQSPIKSAMDLDSKAGGSGDQNIGVGSPRSPSEELLSQPAVPSGPSMPSEPVNTATVDEPATLPLSLEQPAEDMVKKAAVLAKKGGVLQAAPAVVRAPNKAARARCKFTDSTLLRVHYTHS